MGCESNKRIFFFFFFTRLYLLNRTAVMEVSSFHSKKHLNTKNEAKWVKDSRLSFEGDLSTSAQYRVRQNIQICKVQPRNMQKQGRRMEACYSGEGCKHSLNILGIFSYPYGSLST